MNQWTDGPLESVVVNGVGVDNGGAAHNGKKMAQIVFPVDGGAGAAAGAGGALTVAAGLRIMRVHVDIVCCIE